MYQNGGDGFKHDVLFSYSLNQLSCKEFASNAVLHPNFLLFNSSGKLTPTDFI